jgi:hypothetical protein
MTVQWDTGLRDGLNDLITTTLGAGWKLKIRTGAQPANVATASSGSIVGSLAPTATASSTGTKAFVTGSPTFAALVANAGGAMHYELTTSADVVKERGSVTATGGGGDLTIDNLYIAVNQTVQITGFTKTCPGA